MKKCILISSSHPESPTRKAEDAALCSGHITEKDSFKHLFINSGFVTNEVFQKNHLKL